MMADDKQHHDPLETMLADLRDAERANVFDHTPAEPKVLIADAQPTLSLGRMRRMAGLLTAAAVVALSVGLWSLTAQYRGSPGGTVVDQSSSLNDRPCDGSFVRCFSGPEPGAMASRCLVHDYDADGDIDLADYRDYQIHCNRPPSATP